MCDLGRTFFAPSSPFSRPGVSTGWPCGWRGAFPDSVNRTWGPLHSAYMEC